jgi:hypothetical protein
VPGAAAEWVSGLALLFAPDAVLLLQTRLGAGLAACWMLPLLSRPSSYEVLRATPPPLRPGASTKRWPMYGALHG